MGNQKPSKDSGKASTISNKYGTRSKRLNVTPSPKVETHKTAATPRRISRGSVAAHALATFGSPEKTRHWMNRPNELFKGKTPAQVIELDLVGVEAELVRIDHGVYA
jgi:uncharacterized protein (DUF2384 family)